MPKHNKCSILGCADERYGPGCCQRYQGVVSPSSFCRNKHCHKKIMAYVIRRIILTLTRSRNQCSIYTYSNVSKESTSHTAMKEILHACLNLMLQVVIS